ncbi:MAG TPA: WhiB family transcriptional regulator [Pilimelia sp.]|nr:WhiB family transcriptional regulator [Pilimelia sp.]
MTRSALSRTAWGLDSPHTTNWRELARCRDEDPELMYPLTAADIDLAKAVCAGCPVKAECLAEGDAFGDYHGVRGGKSGDERKQAARARLARTCGCGKKYVPANSKQDLCPWCADAARRAAIRHVTCPDCQSSVPEDADGQPSRHRVPGKGYARRTCRPTTTPATPIGAPS